MLARNGITSASYTNYAPVVHRISPVHVVYLSSAPSMFRHLCLVIEVPALAICERCITTYLPTLHFSYNGFHPVDIVEIMHLPFTSLHHAETCGS